MFKRYKQYQEDVPIINEINSTMTKCVTDWYGPNAYISSPKPIVKANRNSFFIIYDIAITSKKKIRVFLKIRRQTRLKSLSAAINSNITHDNTRKEYEALVAIYNFFKDKVAMFDVVRPLFFFDKWYAMAIEERQSTHLDKLIHDWPLYTKIKVLNFPDLLNAVQKVGYWLATYHREMHSQQEVPYSSQELSDEIREALSNLSTASNETLQLERLNSAFSQKIAGLNLETLPFSIIHGDFKNENILVTHDNRICVIDLKPTHDTIYSDLGQILIDPDTYKIQIFTFGVFFSKRFLEKYRDAIIKGYFQDEPFDQALVKLYCAISLLDKWTLNEKIINNYQDFRKYVSLSIRPIMRYYFNKLILSYLSPETG